MSGTDLLARAEALRRTRTPFVLATVVRAERPTSAKAGDCALVLADGTLDGFIGGSCAQSTVALHALRALEHGQSTLLRITPEPAEAGPPVEGLVTVENPCLSGGTLDIFLDAVLPPMLVQVYGAAPISQALAAVGAAAGFDVVVHSDPGAPIPLGTSAVVVASHGRDEPAVLTAALRAGVPYIGLVASRRRGAAVLDTLDPTLAARDRVRTPAGLDIDARTPPEVAVSVLAEIIATRPRTGVGTAVPTGTAVPGEAVEAVDPVCSMTVAVTPGALRFDHAGRAWYFCGPGCRQAFAANPSDFAAGVG